MEVSYPTVCHRQLGIVTSISFSVFLIALLRMEKHFLFVFRCRRPSVRTSDSLSHSLNACARSSISFSMFFIALLRTERTVCLSCSVTVCPSTRMRLLKEQSQGDRLPH